MSIRAENRAHNHKEAHKNAIRQFVNGFVAQRGVTALQLANPSSSVVPQPADVRPLRATSLPNSPVMSTVRCWCSVSSGS